MPLSAGTRVGAYEILAPIGAGGMGEVYRARDSKLKREVAVKVLPVTRAGDSGLMARFQREAEVLAALNHPNIASIYGVEDCAFVMELVEGESLRSIVDRGPISLETALRYAAQLAEALEAAHEKGIIHRDVKPANVMVTSGGTVKVLDFGLATVFQRAESDLRDNPSGTMTMSDTQPGMILGTARYMSPEQAAGKPADKRADIWSFGVVLWEMLTGRALFDGETSSHVLAEVLRGSIDFDKLPRDTPESIRALLRRCLDRDVRNRLRDIGEARVAIQQAGKEPAAVPRRTGRLWPAVAGLLLLSTSVLAVREWRSGTRSRAVAPLHAVLELTPAASLANEKLGRPHLTAMTFSPDGNTLVFSGSAGGQTQLYKRALDQPEAVPIPDTVGATGPFFSPDGQWIAFLAEGGLKKVSIRGGPAVRICDTGLIWGATWGAGGSIVFAEDGSLKQVSAAGGAPVLLVEAANGEVYSSPEFLPDGRTLVFTTRSSNNWDEAKIVARRPEGGAPKVLLQGGADARYLPHGYLVYLHSGVLMAVAFDPGRLAISGTPVPIVDRVMQSVNASLDFYESGIGQFAVSASGTLLYASGGIYRTPDASMVRVDRKGAVTDLNLKGLSYGLRLSPDGRRLAVSKTISYLSYYIEVYDLARGTSTRLTSEGQENWPVWSPDGQFIAFVAGDGSMVSVRADGGGGKETLVKHAIPASWSPDGKWLAYLRWSAGRWTQIGRHPMSGHAEPRLFLDSKFDVADVEFSPDGKWIAYVSKETGVNEVYVQAFPGPGPKQRISTSGGTNPAWARSGRELFYLDGTAQQAGIGSKMMVVGVEMGSQFRAGTPRPLFVLPDGLWIQTTPLRNYDIYPDGQHFIVMRRKVTQEAPVTKLSLVLNWSEELKRRVSAAN